MRKRGVGNLELSDGERRRTRSILIGVTLACCALGLIAPYVMYAGVLAGTAEAAAARRVWYGGLSFPFVLVVTPVAGWFLFLKRSYRTARWMCVLPLLWLVYVSAVILLWFALG
jgi:hypothetical protein